MQTFNPAIITDPSIITNPADAVMHVELSSAYADSDARAEATAAWMTDPGVAANLRAQYGTDGVGPFGAKAPFGPRSSGRDYTLILADLQVAELTEIGHRSGGTVGIVAGMLHTPAVPGQSFAVDTFRRRPDRYI